MTVWDNLEFAMRISSLRTTNVPASPFYKLITFILKFIFQLVLGKDVFVLHFILFESLA
jgi:hypothetical protein